MNAGPETPSIAVKEYRISPFLRSCCWHTIFVGFVFSIVLSYVLLVVQNRGPEKYVGLLLMIALLPVAMVIVLSWKLRIDQNGVSRRLLFHWSSWDWNAISSGRIRKLYPYTLYDPERPWWCRTLRLGCMDSDDIKEVISVINLHYRLPTPPEILDQLKVRYGFRRSAAFDYDGIQLTNGDSTQEYMWSDLREILITRMDPLRRDFKNLLIVLPDQEVQLTYFSNQGRRTQAWQGATAEEINEFFQKVVPEDRLEILIAGEPISNREYLERKLRQAEKNISQMKLMYLISGAFLIYWFASMAQNRGIVKPLIMILIFAMICGPVLYEMHRAILKKYQELKDNMASLDKHDDAVE